MTDRPKLTSGDPEVEGGAAPWFDQPADTAAGSAWARYRDLTWAAIIIVVVIGLGVWNLLTHGPIHPHV